MNPSPVLVGGFFTTEAPQKPELKFILVIYPFNKYLRTCYMSDTDKDAGDTTVDKTVMTALRDCTLVGEQNIKSTTIICY